MKRIDMKQAVSAGLNSYQLKMIALFFMTLDHIGLYLDFLPLIHPWYYLLRALGRIAAPLFLYVTVQGLHHTRSKLRYTTRLYIASMLMELANFLFSSMINRHIDFNIFRTLFYTAFYISLAEGAVKAVSAKKYKSAVLHVTGILLSFLSFLPDWAGGYLLLYQPPYSALAARALQIIFPSPFAVEYSLLFVAFGVLVYFINHKRRECTAYALFCLICLLGGEFTPSTGFLSLGDLFVPLQAFMALALPLMLLYNGQKGKGKKYFFYFYYPLHQYVLGVVAVLAALRF